MPIDQVTLQIFANHCSAAAETTARTLLRTAHSTFVRESEDFTIGIVTPKGQTFASPFSFGATWFVGLDYAAALALIDEYHEGDICLTNDPYSGFVCTHSPDMHLWKPVFYQGELLCFVAGHIHNTDVGGAVPASLSRTLTEVHQEGIRIPPSKIYRGGELNEELLSIMLANVRMPEQNWGDLKAQAAAMNTGEQKVQEIVKRFGIATFREGAEQLLDQAEQQARNLIRKIPDGEYFFADYMDEDGAGDGDGAGGNPARIAVNLIVNDDELIFDYTGSDPQLTSSFNIPTGGDERHVLMMVGLVYVLYTLDPSILRNAGLARAARCVLPEGSIVNPQFPAAVGMRSLGTVRVMSAMFGAFAQALPDVLQAGPGGGGTLVNVRTTDNLTGRQVMANVSPITAGAGGSADGDGTEGNGHNESFFKNTPVEINEAETPIKVINYSLAPDSGGPGKHRGGLATSLTFQVFSPNTTITARNRDRVRFTPYGTAGGAAGASSEFILNPGTDNEVSLGNTDVVTINPGDVVRFTGAGGGGWGSPLERPAERVLTDVRRAFVTVEGAKRDYGVVILDARVDTEATLYLRAERAANADDAFFGHSPGRVEFESRWTLRAYDKLTEVLWRLPVNWRFYAKQKIFATIDATCPDGEAASEDAVEEAYARLLAQQPQLKTQLGLE